MAADTLAYQFQVLSAKLERMSHHDPRYWTTRDARGAIVATVVDNGATYAEAAARLGSTPSTIGKIYRDHKADPLKDTPNE
jgi:transposase-like protein